MTSQGGTLNLSPPPLCLLSAPPSSLQVPVGSLYRDFPPPPAPISFSDRLSLDPLPPPPLPAQAAVGPETFYPPSDEEAEPDHDAMDIKPVHRFIPDSVKNFFRNSGRSGKSWSLRKSDRSSSPKSKQNGHSTGGKPCSPPHSAPPSPSLPGSYRDPYGGSGGSYVSQKDALLLGADAIDSVSSVPTNTSVQTYAERVEEYHQRYAYMKSWAGLLRILGCVELLLGAAVFACVCAYVHKDNEWFNMYGYSTPQLYGGLGGGAYGASGIPYTGPKTPFVLVVAGLAWIVTVILLVLGMSLYYRAILLDSAWWPLTECAINLALGVLYLAAGVVYVRDTTRGGMCNLPVFNNGLNGAFCRVEAGQTAAIVFLFITMVLYFISSVVCLKLWRHEAARLRRQAYDQEVRCHNVPPPYTPNPPLVQTDQRITLVSLYRKYPSIQSDEEREKYRAVFNDQYAEYRELHAEVQSVVQRFEEMDEMMRNLQSSRPSSQMERERINSIFVEYQRKKTVSVPPCG
uniref:Uncharacterized protein n=1 Tax=Periophthalmus magnuspinnatus TaxID=409849 RepID=A0A3B3ZAC0_9GOBI